MMGLSENSHHIFKTKLMAPSTEIWHIFLLYPETLKQNIVFPATAARFLGGTFSELVSCYRIFIDETKLLVNIVLKITNLSELRNILNSKVTGKMTISRSY